MAIKEQQKKEMLLESIKNVDLEELEKERKIALKLKEEIEQACLAAKRAANLDRVTTLSGIPRKEKKVEQNEIYC